MPFRVPLHIRIARTRRGRGFSAHSERAEKQQRGLSRDERLFALGTRTLADLIAPSGDRRGAATEGHVAFERAGSR